MTSAELQQEALTRALTSPSMSNYPAIFHGFIEKGISEDDIKPRENIFSFHAWKALGRQVRKGEHGIKIATIRKGEKIVDNETGETVKFSSPWFVTVFHVSQTDPIGVEKCSYAVGAIKPWSNNQTEPKTAEQQGFTIGGFINKASRQDYYSTEFTPSI